MNHPTSTDTPTFGSVWALQQKTFLQIQESNRFLTEKFAETDRLQRENAQSLKETERFLKEQQAETDRLQRENAQSLKETERFLKEQHTETDRFLSEKFAESDRQRIKNWENYEKRMKKMEERMGSWSNSHGSFAEEYFFNSFDAGEQNFFGEQFVDIEKNVKPKSKNLKDEYDIVLYNHTSVAIIEVKYKAHENDIAQTLKKASTFRILCPDYKDFKIYLGLASLCFYPELEQKCTEQGIAIIKQVGDMVVINDAHLKVF